MPLPDYSNLKGLDINPKLKKHSQKQFSKNPFKPQPMSSSLGFSNQKINEKLNKSEDGYSRNRKRRLANRSFDIKISGLHFRENQMSSSLL